MISIEIIPNWHPIFVHFTVGLLSVSALLYLVGLILKKPNLLVAARWNLWVGGGITIATVLAGFYAYNTVAHDGPSHAAMTDHKNWALVTASIFGALALWSILKHRGAKTVSSGFVVLILFASGLLAVTGYKGGEAVYRHGLGVMRIPEVSGDGGHGSHSHGESASPGHHGAEETNSHGEGASTGHHGMEKSDSQGDHGGHNAEMEKPVEEKAQDVREEHDHGSHAH